MTYFDAFQKIANKQKIDIMRFVMCGCPGLFFACAPGSEFNLCIKSVSHDCSECWQRDYSGERVLDRYAVKPEFIGKTLECEKPIRLNVETLFD